MSAGRNILSTRTYMRSAMSEIKKKLRLVLFERCNRNCDGCCNKDWDLKSLPVETNFTGYHEVLLTGGEPMLRPMLVIHVAKLIRKKQPDTRIYLYTAKTDPWAELLAVLHYIDGLCVTLHDQSDVDPFLSFSRILGDVALTKSLRLNVFSGVKIHKLSLWKTKRVQWIKNCPLPKGEVLKRFM